MPNWLRALLAGYAAKKLGCGCFSTILIFILVYFALGQCNHPAVRQGYHPAGVVAPAAKTAALSGTHQRLLPVLWASRCNFKDK